MPDKSAGMDWLRVTGNEGLIIETVNAQTLAAFAKTQALAGSPLPDDTFTVGVAPYTSITRAEHEANQQLLKQDTFEGD